MSHYRLSDDAPSAIITSKNSELRIYEGNRVFLNNKDNFEIRFFNPLSETIGAEILFNGKSTSKSLLVLKPGQDVILDRFIGEKRKMLFETYHIDGNNEKAVQAAKQNGLIEIKFYKEKVIVPDYNTYYTTRSYCGSTNTGGLPHYGNTPGVYSVQSFSSDASNSLIGGVSDGTVNINLNDMNATSNINVNVNYSDTIDKNIDYSQYLAENLDPKISYSDYLAEHLDKNIPYSESVAQSTQKLSKKVETGRIEKGEKSNQKLDLVDMKFEDISFLNLSYLLLPISQQQSVTYSEIRNYCPHCSYRIRKANWHYCPKCGEQI